MKLQIDTEGQGKETMKGSRPAGKPKQEKKFGNIVEQKKGVHTTVKYYRGMVR